MEACRKRSRSERECAKAYSFYKCDLKSYKNFFKRDRFVPHLSYLTLYNTDIQKTNENIFEIAPVDGLT